MTNDDDYEQIGEFATQLTNNNTNPCTNTRTAKSSLKTSPSGKKLRVYTHNQAHTTSASHSPSISHPTSHLPRITKHTEAKAWSRTLSSQLV